MSYACGKRYYVCVTVTCMLWCSDTESVPLRLLVSNIHDIIFVRSQYVLVCTGLYSYSIPVPVCTRYVPVRTGSEPVRTKYPVPVMRLTIPDELASLEVIMPVWPAALRPPGRSMHPSRYGPIVKFYKFGQPPRPWPPRVTNFSLFVS
jgi:hypothetical protein